MDEAIKSGVARDEGATRRLQLTLDQRAVLEAVYAMRTCPDSHLRKSLAAYLNVWFQNRRQREQRHRLGNLTAPSHPPPPSSASVSPARMH
ncbi:hypothetical protein EMIHUDRAFT_314765 [Emiliania huxleyi CCMP1516]|uniref:Homeobox domain-containing protein n=2 Tax=Emiliania huxleyi TaxID=2903 RepID=A0A0D3IHX8_EMIH1|nr:hypothetical protein EMIHUDRAFT_311656 [Emiliania huxleyi CCMP1516]XP_005781447.1 hypothetical protein EMIHUDRAFT_314765 [Emiliania huxleyi CCMP1516]EOD10863.1 hypothetical protein EMIHUDRAFT_311656 [Emiliania huxleyi CCMP1516]EOD29018.1 hypothetical protein EMIHUDRAFT_314765 [Emiliania huxleyi CCMP1516]|eukprot:XP_005763292.1 hypothetical protein EMIHUDRAFT_311656 [Emiliania huxleyi CCMP1516]